MSEQKVSMGHQIGEKLIRVVIAVVGLLILDAILSALPILKSSVVYMPSFSGGQTATSAGQFAQWQQQAFQALQAVTGGSLSGAVADALLKSHVAIFPITIAQTVVDTLIFAILIVFGRNVAVIIRSGYAKLPDLGQMINLGILTIVAVLAYHSYQALAYPFLWPDNLNIYGWIFLLLGLAPLVGIGVMVARNMDAITAVVMQGGSKVVSAQVSQDSIPCESCRQPVAAGGKFCPHCGAAVKAAPLASSAGTKQFCPSCGSENPQGAKFCARCGQLMAG
ncbi:MAG: zinc ribbon domain-containing protein [Nitrospiraceae bacterium]|nr:zinc ribbon domain-containing protein [Nitrospiraceae bacterium]